jgi:hypothetical protein
MAMVAPRALLVLGNEGQVWLADKAGYVASRAVQHVYNTFGIGDRFGMANVGGHNHCALPTAERPYVNAFINKYLQSDETANTDVFVFPASYATYKYKFWMPWAGEADDAAEYKFWREAESDCSTIGDDFTIVDLAAASDGKHITKGTASPTEAPTEKEAKLEIPFRLLDHGHYTVYARINIAGYTARDSVWVSIEDAPKKVVLAPTFGAWSWIKIAEKDILAGDHTLTIAGATTTLKIDRFHITNRAALPTGAGGEEDDCIEVIYSTIFDFEIPDLTGWTRQNNGNNITLSTEDPHGGAKSLKIVNGTATNAWSSQVYTPAVPLVIGHNYKVTFWIKAISGTAKGRISTQNANQLGGQYWADFNVPADEWTQITYDNLVATATTVGIGFDLGYTAGRTLYLDDIEIIDKDVAPPVTAIETVDASGYALGQNYPNPATEVTYIPVTLAEQAVASLKVYNVTGQQVADLSGSYPQGVTIVSLETSSLPKGIYFYTLKVAGYTESKKLIVK